MNFLKRANSNRKNYHFLCNVRDYIIYGGMKVLYAGLLGVRRTQCGGCGVILMRRILRRILIFAPHTGVFLAT
jgi:hypothetical protein